MTTHDPEATSDSASDQEVSPPIAAALGDVGEAHFPFTAGAPRPAPDERWYRFDELIRPDALRDRVVELTGDYDDDPKVATAFLAARLLSPLARLAIRPLIEQDRAVIARADHLWLRRHPRGWHNGLSVADPRLLVTATDPLADQPGAEVVDDLAIIRRRAVASVLALAAPIVDGLRGVGKLGARALWGQLGDAVVSTVARHHDADGDSEMVRARVRSLTANDDRLWVDPEITHIDIGGHVGLAWRRDSCCLAYRLDRYGYCTGCPLLARDEWWRRSVASVRERVEEHGR